MSFLDTTFLIFKAQKTHRSRCDVYHMLRIVQLHGAFTTLVQLSIGGSSKDEEESKTRKPSRNKR